jgi:hypothetical protein
MKISYYNKFFKPIIEIINKFQKGKNREVENVFDLFDESVHDIITELQANNIPFETKGTFDLMEKSRIIASSELAIPKYKIVIDPFDETSAKRFVKAGYTVFSIADFSIDNIKKKK